MSERERDGQEFTPGDEHSRPGQPHPDSEFEDSAIREFEREGPTGPIKTSHPPGLFLLFITEMWERFSYYGMRALLVLFMTSSVAQHGFGWGNEQAGELYAWYTSLVYLTPVFGGMLADKLIGTHRSMVIGGAIIMLGHFALAFMGLFDPASTTVKIPFFIGLALIILGTGFFKPCVSVMVGQLYEKGDPRRDAGFTIFYMGINVGALIGALACGWLGETIGWHWGFGAAGVGMFFGLIAYLIGRPRLLKGIGLPPVNPEPVGPLLRKMGMLIGGVVVVGGLFVFLKGFNPTVANIYLLAVIAGLIGLVVWFVRIQAPEDRGPMAALFIISFFVIFFWFAFEQAGSSMNVFARDRTDRAVQHGYADGSIESGGFEADVWSGGASTLGALLSGGKTPEEATGEDEEAQRPPDQDPELLAKPPGDGTIRIQLKDGDAFEVSVDPEDSLATLKRRIESASEEEVDVAIDPEQRALRLVDESGGEEELRITDVRGTVARDLGILTVREFPASWYQSINPAYILIFAPVFAWLWLFLARRRLEPSTPVKMGIGLILLGFGFVLLVLPAYWADGGRYVTDPSMVNKVAPYWLVGAYLLHTWGELCLSPIGLSLVTKLAAKQWVSLMMGVWFMAPAIAQFIGGYTFSYIDKIESGQLFDPIIGGQADFWLIFVITSVGAGLLLLAITPIMKRLIGSAG